MIIIEMFTKRTYSDQEKATVYNALLLKMKQAVSQNKSLVLDATFHDNEIRKQFIKEMEGKGGIFFIEVTANEHIVRERLKKERPYSEADFKVYTFIQQRWEPMTESHLVLQSTDENIDHMLQKATQYLRQTNDKRTDQ